MITSGIIQSGVIQSGMIGSGMLGLGSKATSYGAYLNFLTQQFRTTVPQASSRTFLETHVYTGSPKLTLQSTGFLGWNQHNWLPTTEDLTTSSYVPSATTVALDTTVPSGVQKVTTLTDTAANAAHYIRHSGGTAFAPIGATVTLEFIANAKALTDFQTIEAYIANAGSTAYAGAKFNLVTGTASASIGDVTYSTSTYSQTDIGGGYYRCRIYVVTTGSTANRVEIYLKTGTSYVRTTANSVNISAMHVYRDNTQLTYLANPSATVPRLDAPYYWNTSAVRQGVLVEPAATNSCLWSDDMTNAGSGGAWVASNITTAKTATGADGIANSATTLTATGANGTCLQTFVSASATRQYGAYIKRRTGTGNIQMTVDNGATWTTVTATSLFTLVSINQAAVTNPVIGFRIVTSGDAIDVQYNQLENAGTVTTSPIPTTTAAVTRTVDGNKPIIPFNVVQPYSIYMDWTMNGPTGAISGGDVLNFNGIVNGVGWYFAGSVLNSYVRESNSTTALVSPSNGGGINYGVAIKCAVRYKTNDTRGAANASPGAAADTSNTPTTIDVGGFSTIQVAFGGTQLNANVRNFRIYASGLSDADCQTLATGGTISATPIIDYNYETASYIYTPVNAGVTTTYTAATLVTSGKLTQTGPSAVWLRNSAGLLASVDPAATALIEYAADGSVLGFIGDEPARTNIFIQSNDTSATTVNASTRSTSPQLGPISGVYLARYTETVATGFHGWYQANTVTAAPWTLSAFVKKGTRQYVLLGYSNGSTKNAWSIFDLDNGTITQSGGAASEGGYTSASATITSYGSGLYRITLTATLEAAILSAQLVNVNLSTIPSLASGYPGYAGSITDYSDCGCIQSELGSYASSYIPTTTIAVTRAAIVSTLNLGSEFDNSRSIIASKVYAGRANMTDGSVTPAVWSLNLATPASTDYEVVYLTGTNQINYLDRVASTDGAAGQATSLAYPATIKTAFGYSPSNVFLSLNGATQAVTGTPSPIQASYTLLRLGTSPRTNVTQGSVYIQNLTIAPTVPTQVNVNAAASAT